MGWILLAQIKEVLKMKQIKHKIPKIGNIHTTNKGGKTK